MSYTLTSKRFADAFDEDTVCDDTGKDTHIIHFLPDYDYGPPQNECDGHGETIELRFDPTDMDAEELDDQLGLDSDDDTPHAIEQRLRYSMMLRLSSYHYHGRYDPVLYYDVWETLKKARAEGWGCIDHDNDPQATEKLHAIVMEDYNYLKGWYHDDWHYCTIAVTPLHAPDPDYPDDLEPDEDYTEYCGGVEYGHHTEEEKAHHNEIITDLVRSIEHRKQAELAEVQPSLL